MQQQPGPARRPEAPGPVSAIAHLGVMALVATILGVLTAGLVIPFAGVAGLAAREVADGMDNLPEQLEAKPLAQKTSILDSQGNLIASLYDENRINVGLDQVSRTMVQSILSIEDYRFYSHGALDLKGTLRALVTNQANQGAIVQGGSSITQQMVKMTLISQAKTKKQREAATDDTYARKIRELRYAIAFERNYSKDWILERYLNLAYFGDGAHGIQAAARHFFSKNADHLNLRQSALLAGLVKNPVGYDPTVYPDKAKQRRNVVLDRMQQLHVITPEQAEKAKNAGLGLKLTKAPNGCVQSQAPFFCDFVLSYLKLDPSLGKTAAEREQLLYSGGLTIRTTLDLEIQKAADASVSAHVYPTDNAIGGLAMVEPRTGAVRALAQSRPMGRNRKAGETYLNYVVPENYGDSQGFQAGSTFKAFVLAAALKQGEVSMHEKIRSPESIVLRKEDFKDCNGAPYSYGEWPVSNSTTSGDKDMYTGTRESVNTYYAQLEQRTGLCEPFKLAREMGVRLTNPKGDANGNGAERVASFVLGVANTSPLEMAEAYATFAGRGLHCSSTPVTSIEDMSGNTLKAYVPTCKQVLPGAVADAVNDVLRGVQEPGGFGYGAGLALSVPSAGKTGTINRNMAVWFIGYTPQLATAAMIAGANYEGSWVTLNGQSVGGRYIGEAFGSTVAGPMWGDAMKAIQGKLEYQDFTPPAGDVILGALTKVPAVSGQSIDEARATLTGLGFEVEDGGKANSEVPEGQVAYSSPGAGSELSSGDTVYLYTSTGVVPPPEPKGKGTKGKGKGRAKNGNNGNGNG